MKTQKNNYEIFEYNSFFTESQLHKILSFATTTTTEEMWERYIRKNIEEQTYGQYGALVEDVIETEWSKAKKANLHNKVLDWTHTNMKEFFEYNLSRCNCLNNREPIEFSELLFIRHNFRMNDFEITAVSDNPNNNSNWVMLYFWNAEEDSEIVFHDINLSFELKKNQLILIKANYLYDFMIQLLSATNMDDEFLYYTIGRLKNLDYII